MFFTSKVTEIQDSFSVKIHNLKSSNASKTKDRNTIWNMSSPLFNIFLLHLWPGINLTKIIQSQKDESITTQQPGAIMSSKKLNYYLHVYNKRLFSTAAKETFHYETHHETWWAPFVLIRHFQPDCSLQWATCLKWSLARETGSFKDHQRNHHDWLITFWMDLHKQVSVQAGGRVEFLGPGQKCKLSLFQDKHHNEILALISCIDNDSQLLPFQFLINACKTDCIVKVFLGQGHFNGKNLNTFFS